MYYPTTQTTSQRSVLASLRALVPQRPLAPREALKEAPATAVVYLRVSTARQAKRGGEAEGFSLPAQRRACEQKAASLGARIGAEFIDPGESATTMNRPEFQRMLAFVRATKIDYLIFYSVDRLFRRAEDALACARELNTIGTAVASSTENFDPTPEGFLNYAMKAVWAEYESKKLGARVEMGMEQKARFGGTPGKAQLGYLNVLRTRNGQVVRTVITDRVRAPYMAWAFEAYATGEWSLSQLAEELERRGLVTRRTLTRPPRPLSRAQLHRLLRSPYYKGVVAYDGAEYRGRHKALVSEGTWQRVQVVLTARNLAGERQRHHPHYLIGSAYCGNCASRLLVDHARSKSGRIYRYFVCAGRHQKRTDCLFKATQIRHVEREVVTEYGNHGMTPDERAATEAWVTGAVKKACSEAIGEAKRLARRKQQLLLERDRLLRAHLAGAVPLDQLTKEQERISKELTYAEARLTQAEISEERIARHLSACLDLLVDVQGLYRKLGKPDRRILNQALFTRLEVTEDDEVQGELVSPFDVLAARRSGARCLTKTAMVRLAGQLSNPSETLQKALDLHCEWRANIKHTSSRRLKPKAKMRRTRHNPPIESSTLR
jgi:site-specific DNA recombinase